MKRFPILLAVALAGIATQASAIDVVKIRNTTDTTLKYKMRCAEPSSDWKSFSTNARETSEITAQTCERFGFEMGTKNQDGSVVTVKYRLDPNAWYRLVYSRDKDRWDLRKVKQTDF